MRIRSTLFSIGLLAIGAALAAPSVAAQYGAGTRIWVENDRDYYRTGDRLRVNFSTRANSYVAVIHVDADGYLEFLYPTSPWDSEFVRGGVVHALDRSGWRNGLMVRGNGGIGYLYVVASPVPLDYSRFRAGRGAGWDWSYAGRQVAGDPFWAMEQITRSLLPGWHNVPYAADYYTYYVGGRHAYPSYACSRPATGWGWGYSPQWTSYYGSCSQLDRFLLDDPYYFDSRRYRGDRWRHYRDYRDERDWDPRHSYKADPRSPAGSPVQRATSPSAGPDRANPVRPATPASREPVREPAPAQRPSATPQPATRPQPSQPQPAQPPARDARPAARPRPAPAQPARPPTREVTPATRDRSPEPARPSTAPAPRQRPVPSTPSSRGSAGSGESSGGESSSTPRSRRGG